VGIAGINPLLKTTKPEDRRDKSLAQDNKAGSIRLPANNSPEDLVVLSSGFSRAGVGEQMRRDRRDKSLAQDDKAGSIRLWAMDFY
jgi:hypothetical protein